MNKYESLLLAALLTGTTVAAGAAEKAPSFARADLAAVATLRDRGLADETAYRLIESLTTEVGPRPAGSPGDKAAVAWAAREMKRIGLANVRTPEVTVPHWERGDAEFAVTSPFPQTIPVLALGGSVGTGAAGIEGDAVQVADLKALAALPADAVKGRIVFFNGRMERTRDGKGYGAAVPVRAAGPTAAAKLGAIAVVIRSVGTSHGRFPHTGTTRYAADAPRIPAFALSNPDADALERQFASGQAVRLRLRSSARDLPTERSANVIGEIPGSDRASEIVILAAHLDSWDPGTGAIDNAAGCAILMGAMKLINEAGLKPRRTIRVVLFANEEFGLSGSRAYVAENTAELEKHVVGFEADFGAGPVWRLASRVNPAQLPAVDQIYRAMQPFKLVRGGNEATGGADLDGLAKLGMAIISPDLDGSNYFDVHHTANDTLAQVDPAAVRQSTAAFAAAIWLAAQYPGDWQRVTTEKPARR